MLRYRSEIVFIKMKNLNVKFANLIKNGKFSRSETGMGFALSIGFALLMGFALSMGFALLKWGILMLRNWDQIRFVKYRNFDVEISK